MKIHPSPYFLPKAFLVLTLAIPLMLTSCDKKAAPAAKEQVFEVEWNWKNYPQDRILKLGSFPVSLQPKQSIDLNSNYEGILTLYTQQKTSMVQKDFLWAEMDKKKLEKEKRKIEITKNSQALSKVQENTVNRPQKLKEAKKALDKARKKVALAKRIYGSRKLQKHTSVILDGNIKTVTKKAIRELEEEVSLAEKRLVIATDIETELYDNEQELQTMQQEETDSNFEKAKEAAAYKIPFDGELRIELDLLPNQKEYSVTARQTLATLNDYSEIHATLNVQRVSWINLAPQSLVITLENQQKTAMSYIEDRVEKNTRTRKEEKHYVFGIPLKNNESLKRLTGTQLNATLTTKLSERCYIVPKFDLAMYAKGKTKSLDYATLVSELWPGAKVLASGTSHLAIYYTPKRAINSVKKSKKIKKITTIQTPQDE